MSLLRDPSGALQTVLNRATSRDGVHPATESVASLSGPDDSKSSRENTNDSVLRTMVARTDSRTGQRHANAEGHLHHHRSDARRLPLPTVLRRISSNQTSRTRPNGAPALRMLDTTTRELKRSRTGDQELAITPRRIKLFFRPRARNPYNRQAARCTINTRVETNAY